MSRKVIDLTGKRFESLLVLSPANRKGRGHMYWECQCDCGKRKTIDGYNLRQGFSRSCGCRRKEFVDKNRSPNGEGSLRIKYGAEYAPWRMMKQRCYNSNHTYYHHYGGRGITVCFEWINSFQAFLKDMGTRPEGTSLDRINNDGNYEPGNCRWSTPKEQANNQRRHKKAA